MEKLLATLMYSYYIKKVSDVRFGVIASYKSDLEKIATDFNVILIESGDSAGKLTVWGLFELKG